MEYAPLTLSSCPPSYFGLLDKSRSKTVPGGSSLPRFSQTSKLPSYNLYRTREMWRVCVPPARSTRRAPRTSLLSEWATSHPRGTREARTENRLTVCSICQDRDPSSVLLC
ncbi:hypothetical protein E2C01_050998 [Portunus trituberculatus]|uniref:Uncharacterized protein n=1 Tax=Portunus trituberculatus TaxID=210409 RepID=A0A5B7G9T5_PORTR|nr:hypothetical protein [Portunus trituberculatus]